MSGIIVDVEARTAEAERRLAEINKSLLGIETNTNRVTSTISNAFRNIGVTIVSGGILAGLKNVSSEFQGLENRIASVTGRTKDLVNVQEQLYDIAFATNSTIKNSVETYANLGRAVKNIGVSQEKILQVTKAIQQTVSIAGGDAQSAASALVQLGQGLASGALRGQELNSVMEQAPRLAQALSDELGVTTGQLRAIAEQGKLTSETVFNALLKQSQAINKEFQVIGPTLDQSLSKVIGGVKIYVNEFDKGLGLSKSLGLELGSIADSVRAASKDAFQLGANLAYGLATARGMVSQIGGPILSVFKALGDQVLKTIPKGSLTRTLAGDVNEALRLIDSNFLGGMISSFKKFKFSNLITVRSDVEKAIFDLQRLNPKYWAGAGWDIPTMRRFFSRENLGAYSKAFAELARALAGNLTDIRILERDFVISLDFMFKAISRYFGFRMDTLFTFKSGQVSALLVSIAQITKGITEMGVKIFNVRRLFEDNFFPATYAVKNAFEDAFKTLPGFVTGVVRAVVQTITAMARGIHQIIHDTIPSINIGNYFVKATRDVDNFFDALDSDSKLDKALDGVKSFAQRVIDAFFRIYDEVIGHSWWTDTVETVVNTSNSLWENVKSGFGKFADNTVDTFRRIKERVVEQFYSMELTLVGKALSLLKNIEGPFESIGNKLLKGFSNRELSRNFTFSKTPFNEFLFHVDLIFTSVAAIALAGLSVAYNAVKDFSKKVIHEFFEIYDQVIGHSWWTDTVETVVSTSNNLWERASSGLMKFKDNTINIFKNVFDGSRRMDLSSINFDNISFSLNKFKLPQIDTNSFVDSVISAAVKIRKTFVDLFNTFPSIMKLAITGVYTVLLLALFPASTLKKILVTDAIATLIASGSVLAETFGKILTGGSFSVTLGEALGKTIGSFVNSFLKELPELFNVVLGAATGFLKGFVSQLPILGGAFKTLFAGVGAVGLGNPLGLVGAALFGTLGYKALESVGLEGPLKSVGNIAKTLKAVLITGGSDKKVGDKSFFSTNFFGELGPARTLSLLGLTLDYLGAFDSVFSNSQVAHYAAKGGMLYLALFGQQGVETAWQASKNVIASMMEKLQKSISKVAPSFASFAMPDPFSADSLKTWQQRLGSVMKGALEGVGKQIVDFSSPIVGAGFSFLSKLFLGDDPKKTLGLILNNMKSLFSDAASYIGKFRETLAKFDLFSFLRPSTGGNSTASVLSGASMAFDNIKDKVKSTAETVAKVGGQQGLLGQLLLGKTGKYIAIGTLLALAGTAAFAGDVTSTNKTKETTPLQDLFKDFQNFKLTNPLTALAAEIATVSIPVILGSLFVFRNQVASLLAGLFSTKTLAGFGAGIKELVASIGSVKSSLFVGGVAGVAGLVTYKITDDPTLALVAGTIGSSLGTLIVAGLKTALGTLIAGAIGTVLSAIAIPALVIGAVAAVGGLLYLYFFGEKGQFLKELDGVYQKVKEFVGFKSQVKTEKQELSQEADKINRQQKLGVDYDTSTINRSNLKSKDADALQKRIKDLDELIIAANDRANGDAISRPDADAIAAKSRGIKNTVAKLTSETAYDTKDLAKQVQDHRNLIDNTYAKEFGLWLNQKSLNVQFNLSSYLQRLKKSLPGALPSDIQEANDRLKELESLRNTKYNSRYRPAASDREQGLDRAISGASGVLYEDATLQALIDKQSQRYLDFASRLQKAETSAFGTYKPLSDFDVLKASYNRSVDAFTALLNRKIVFNYQKAQITDFQKAVSDMASAFSEAGVDFNSKGIFAVGEEQFKRIRDMSEELKVLTKQMLETKDTAEHNSIVIRIEEIKTRTVIENLQASKDSRANPAVELPSILQGAGVQGATYDTLRRVPETYLEGLRSQARDVQIIEERLKTRPPKDYNQFGTDEDRRNNPIATRKKYYDAQAEFAAAERDRDAKRSKLAKDAIELQRQFSSPGQFVKDMSSSLNIGDPGLLIRKFGVQGAADQVAKLAKMNNELATSYLNSDKNAGKFAQTIKFLEEDLARAPNTLGESLGLLNNFGSSFQIEDLGGLSAGMLKNLTTASQVAKGIDIEMQRSQGGFNKLEIDSIIKRKLAAAKIAFDAFLETIHNTPEKINQALQKVGITTFAQASNLPGGLFNEALELDKRQRELEFKAKQPNANSKKDYLENLRLLDEVIRRQETIRDLSVVNTNERVSRFNSVLGTNIDEATAVRLGSDTFNMLDKIGIYYKQVLSQAQKTGSIDNLVDIYSNLERAIQKSRIVQTFGELIKNTGNILVEGVKTQFDKFKAVVSDSPLTQESFNSLSAKDRSKYTKDAVQVDTLNKVLLEGVQFPEIRDAFKTSAGAGKSLDEIIDDVRKAAEVSLKGEDLSRFNTLLTGKTETQSLIESNVNLTTAINGLTGAVTGTPVAGGSLPKVTVSARAEKFGGELVDDTSQVGQLLRNLYDKVRIDPVGKLTGRYETSDKLRAIGVETSLNDIGKIPLKSVSNFKVLLDDAYVKSSNIKKLQDSNQPVTEEQIRLMELATIKVKDFLDEIPKTVDKSYEAGKALSGNIQQGITSSLQDFLKGKSSPKSFIKSILDTVTGSIVDSFAKSLTDKFFGEQSPIGKFFKDMGKNLADWIFGGDATGGLLGGSSGSLVGDQGGPTASGGGPLSGILGTLGSVFKNLFSSLGPMISGLMSGFSTGITSLFSIFGFADGGLINGPGTGTSDSILARVSNKEFIVNAKSTQRFLPLLHAINSGVIPKFADGGLVSTDIVQATPIANVKPNKSASGNSGVRQEINIHITGDISRQTKAQIYEMLPQIASGVNSHNRENGYKG